MLKSEFILLFFLKRIIVLLNPDGRVFAVENTLPSNTKPKMWEVPGFWYDEALETSVNCVWN